VKVDIGRMQEISNSRPAVKQTQIFTIEPIADMGSSNPSGPIFIALRYSWHKKLRHLKQKVLLMLKHYYEETMCMKPHVHGDMHGLLTDSRTLSKYASVVLTSETSL
jgi:hypothetical protein